MPDNSYDLSSLITAKKAHNLRQVQAILLSEQFAQNYIAAEADEADNKRLSTIICSLNHKQFLHVCQHFVAHNLSIIHFSPNKENHTWLTYFASDDYIDLDSALKLVTLLDILDQQLETYDKHRIVNQEINQKTALALCLEANQSDKTDAALTLMTHGARIDPDNTALAQMILESELETFKLICKTHIIKYPEVLNTNPSTKNNFGDTWITYLAAQPSANEQINHDKISYLLDQLTKVKPNDKQTLLNTKAGNLKPLHWALGRGNFTIAILLIKHSSEYSIPANLVTEYKLSSQLAKQQLLNRIRGPINDESLFNVMVNRFMKDNDKEELVKLVKKSDERFKLPATTTQQALLWQDLISEALKQRRWSVAELLLKRLPTAFPLSVTTHDAIIDSGSQKLVETGKRFTVWSILEETSETKLNHSAASLATSGSYRQDGELSRKRRRNDIENDIQTDEQTQPATKKITTHNCSL